MLRGNDYFQCQAAGSWEPSSPHPICNVCALRDPSMQHVCLLMPFMSLLLPQLLNQNSSKHFFCLFLQCYSKEKQSFIFVMYKFVPGVIVLFDTINIEFLIQDWCGVFYCVLWSCPPSCYT